MKRKIAVLEQDRLVKLTLYKRNIHSQEMRLTQSLRVNPTTMLEFRHSFQSYFGIPTCQQRMTSHSRNNGETVRTAVFHNYYYLLNLPPCATARQIRKRYTRLTLKLHHWTSVTGKVSPRFHWIQTAYNVLGNPNTKAEYDEFWYHTLKVYDTTLMEKQPWILELNADGEVVGAEDDGEIIGDDAGLERCDTPVSIDEKYAESVGENGDVLLTPERLLDGYGTLADYAPLSAQHAYAKALRLAAELSSVRAEKEKVEEEEEVEEKEKGEVDGAASSSRGSPSVLRSSRALSTSRFSCFRTPQFGSPVSPFYPEPLSPVHWPPGGLGNIPIVLDDSALSRAPVEPFTDAESPTLPWPYTGDKSPSVCIDSPTLPWQQVGDLSHSEYMDSPTLPRKHVRSCTSFESTSASSSTTETTPSPTRTTTPATPPMPTQPEPKSQPQAKTKTKKRVMFYDETAAELYMVSDADSPVDRRDARVKLRQMEAMLISSRVEGFEPVRKGPFQKRRVTVVGKKE
ncbi:hypothetical protein LTR50_004223 [Elasticomyces elasticus]|nr:hypothetical protein LTR50_004223 [Elasticomyces elasticus]